MLLLSPTNTHNLFLKTPLPTSQLPCRRCRHPLALTPSQNLALTLPPSLHWLWSLPTHSPPDTCPPRPLQAVLFDLEGVLIENPDPNLDSLSWLILSLEHTHQPIPLPILTSLQNLTPQEAIYNILEWSTDPAEVRRLSSRKDQIFKCLLTGTFRIRDSTKDFLGRMNMYGVKMGVVSARSKEFATEAVRAVGLEGFFDCVVGGDEVEVGVSSSELFGIAARSLGVEERRCVVMGGSDESVVAASGAGVRAIGVAGKRRVYEFRSGVRVVRWLSEITLRDLEVLVLDDTVRRRGSEWSMEIVDCHSV